MKTSRPGPDVSPLDGRTNGHVRSSMDANSSKGHDDQTAHPTNADSQERISDKRSLKKADVEMDTETQKQTKKILEEFLKKSLEKKSNCSNYENLSKSDVRKIHPGHGQFSRASRLQLDGRTKPTVQHMKHDADQRKLEDLMSGRYRGPSHQVSTVPVAGSDSPDSGRLQRSGSFAKAQRHSVVTELESQANNNEVLRRRNSEGLHAEPHHQEDTLTESGSRADKQLTSPVVHNRASSDPVMVQRATTPKRHTPKKEAKEKKSWLPKLHFKKKREGHKLRSSKDSITLVETDVYGPPGTKIAKTPSDHRRKTPSPPSSPKRTPKLLRRFASIIKKDSPSASQHNIPKRHQSFERVGAEPEAANTESKSNSLPSTVKLSTQVHHTVDDPRHRVVLDGSRRHRKNKGSVQRPTTLDLPKKRSAKLSKRLKRFFIAAPSSSSSSSSSSIASSSSAPDLTLYQIGTTTDGGSMEVPLGQPVPNQNEKDSKPTVPNVRGQYHHSASKSMSDMDSQEKSLSVIAAKLKSIADALQQTQYAGPAGQTRTPDSYYHDIRAKGDRSPGVNRSKSTSATKTASMSLSTSHNMDQARGGEMVHSQRITREDVSRQHQLNTRNWSDRVETERRNASYQRLSHERQQKQTSISSQRSIPKSVHSPERSVSRSSMPPLVKSTSPKLRGSRQSRVTTDGGSVKRHISHVSQHTKTTVTASSPTGSITSIISDQIDLYELVQSDVVPLHGERPEDDVDLGLAAGFAEEDEKSEAETLVTVQQENVEHLSMEAATHTRYRAHTYPIRRLESELDGVEVEEERGAVGGEDANHDSYDDKLVEELVRILRRTGDEMNKERDLERTVINVTNTFAEETFKKSLQKAISIVYDNVSSWRHPEVVELVVIFDMFSAVQHLSMGQAVSGFFNSVINQIVSNFGGWRSLENSIDETSEEMRSYSKDGTTNPHQSKDKSGKDDGDELD